VFIDGSLCVACDIVDCGLVCGLVTEVTVAALAVLIVCSLRVA